MPKPTPGYFESEDYKELTNQLKENKKNNICIIHGQSGIGKSHAVLNTVQQWQTKKKAYVTWFIGHTKHFSENIANQETGLSEEAVSEKLQELVKELKESGRPVNMEEGMEVSKVCEALKTSQEKCLLVFDDVQDIEVIPRQFLTPWPELTILITTMNETLHSNFPEIPHLKMNGFSRDDVLSFFTSGNKESADVFKKAGKDLLMKLAMQFGCLPLGLSLAQSHIVDSRASVQEYLNHLQQQSKAMGRGNTDLSEPERNIFAAVRLLLESRMDDAHRCILKFTAFLLPNNIPTAILKEAYWHQTGREPNIDEFVKAARRLSVLQVAVDDKMEMRTVSIHQMTQRALLHMLPEEEQNELVQSLVKAFLALFTKDTREPREGAFVSQLLPHLFSLLGHPTLSLDNMSSNNKMLTALIRLYEVICYLNCQQRRPALAKVAAQKAKTLCDHICQDLPSKDIAEAYEILRTNGLARFEEDAYGKTMTRKLLTRLNLDVLRSKLAGRQDVQKSFLDNLAEMSTSFQPLRKEQYRALVSLGVGFGDDLIKASYLVELVASVFYTSGRILFYLHGDEKDKYFETASRELHFSHDLSKKFAEDKQVHLLNEVLSQRAGTLYLLKETGPNKSHEQTVNDLFRAIAEYDQLINDPNEYYEYGVLKKVPETEYEAMFCYRSVVDCYKRLTKLAASQDERKAFIQDYNTNAEKMIEFAEKQSTRDREGNIIDGLELLPEVYNMRAQFIIDLYEAGFKEDLPEDDRLRKAIEWAKKALGIQSCKDLRRAKADLLIAAALMMTYELNGDDGEEELQAINETEHLLPKGPLTKKDLPEQADQYLQKSIPIYRKDYPNEKGDIGRANKLVDKIQRCREEEEAKRQARQQPPGRSGIPSRELFAEDAAEGGSTGNVEPHGIEMRNVTITADIHYTREWSTESETTV